MLWGRVDENCHNSISKINLSTYTIERTWHTNFPRSDVGGHFMVSVLTFHNVSVPEYLYHNMCSIIDIAIGE